MSEHVLAQPQKANAPQETTKVVGSLQRLDMNQSEPTTLQEWYLDTVSGTIAEPRLGFDFSGVPALTGMVRQNRPLLRTQPMFQRFPKDGTGGSSTCPTCPEAETTEISEYSEPAAEDAPHAPEVAPTAEPVGLETESAAPGETPASALIVEDSANELVPGQMRKSDFLAQLRTEVIRAAEAAMAGTGRTTKDCPYLEYWFSFYSGKESAHIERAIHKYAPETARAATAGDYIPIVATRVRRSVEVWARTGEITGVPEGLSMGLPGMGLMGGLGRLISGIGSIFFNAREGGARAPEDPQVIQRELGEGRPFEGGVRSRMESAFGMDFSHVRTHTDTTAAGLSNRFNARAFTVGNHVAFGAGEYKPGNLIGDALIAHELAHVVQQGSTSASVVSKAAGDTRNHALEDDADKSAVGVTTSLWSRSKGAFAAIAQNTIPRLRSGLRLQSCGKGKGVGVFSESPRQKYAGYDDSVVPNGLVVPIAGKKDGTREVKVSKSDETMKIVSKDDSIAKVEEKSGYIEVQGKKHDKTEIRALRGKTIIEKLDVSVKREKEITVHYYYIHDNAGHGTKRPIYDEKKLNPILNEVWQRQANVHIKIGITAIQIVNRNLGKVIKLPASDYTNWLAITNLAIAEAVGKTWFHVFFVWDFERIPKVEGVDSVGIQAHGRILLEDDAHPLVIAHEVGHALGLMSHHPKGGIMAESINSISKRVFKKQADKVNP